MTSPELSPGDVHVWRVSLDGPGDRELLSREEEARAERAATLAGKRRFIRSRTVLRRVLAGHAGGQPQDLRFGEGPEGKPFLRRPETDLRFNLSHSGSLCAIAVSRDREVGIDVESVSRKVDVEGVARRVFTPGELDALNSLDPASRRLAFFRCWAAREATVKAIGTGMLTPGVAFRVEADPEKPLSARPVNARASFPWKLVELEVPEGYVGVLASEGEPESIHSLDWDV